MVLRLLFCFWSGRLGCDWLGDLDFWSSRCWGYWSWGYWSWWHGKEQGRLTVGLHRVGCT
jgi:hypothetical protein